MSAPGHGVPCETGENFSGDLSSSQEEGTFTNNSNKDVTEKKKSDQLVDNIAPALIDAEMETNAEESIVPSLVPEEHLHLNNPRLPRKYLKLNYTIFKNSEEKKISDFRSDIQDGDSPTGPEFINISSGYQHEEMETDTEESTVQVKRYRKVADISRQLVAPKRNGNSDMLVMNMQKLVSDVLRLEEEVYSRASMFFTQELMSPVRKGKTMAEELIAGFKQNREKAVVAPFGENEVIIVLDSDEEKEEKESDDESDDSSINVMDYNDSSDSEGDDDEIDREREELAQSFGGRMLMDLVHLRMLLQNCDVSQAIDEIIKIKQSLKWQVQMFQKHKHVLECLNYCYNAVDKMLMELNKIHCREEMLQSIAILDGNYIEEPNFILDFYQALCHLRNAVYLLRDISFKYEEVELNKTQLSLVFNNLCKFENRTDHIWLSDPPVDADNENLPDHITICDAKDPEEDYNVTEKGIDNQVNIMENTNDVSDSKSTSDEIIHNQKQT